MTRLEVYFSGSVQGVGFRYTTKQVSRSFEVAGTVQNLPDGRVKLVCEGTESELLQFIESITTTTYGRVAETEVNRCKSTGEFNGFEILR